MANFHDIETALRDLESAAQGLAQVSALEGGWFTLPKRLFVSDVPEDEKSLVPSLSFIVVYKRGKNGHTTRALFDLGLRREPSLYTPHIQKHLGNRQPMHHLPDVRQSLLNGGLDPSTVDEVILSHVHWDHIGTPSDFPHAKFFVGSGSLNITKNGLKGHMSHSNFQADLFDGLQTEEFPDPSALTTQGVPVGTWRVAGGFSILDFSGNGTVYVVDTPGHLPGHVSLLCKIGQGRWVILVGDACHDLRLLTGEASIAEWSDAEGRTCCIHVDKEKASETLRMLRSWKDVAARIGLSLRIVFAHDVSWATSHPEAFFPGKM
jgi:glyoxylase-like metal-dependent hydrolase (beta-lactamase superfamily II)